MTGSSKTRLCKKFSEIELYGVTRDPEDSITGIYLLRGDLQKWGVIIDHLEMMTHSMSNLPEEYDNIIRNHEDKLLDNIYPLPMEIIWYHLFSKYDRINALSIQKEQNHS